MSLVKLKSAKGAEIYVNPNYVAILSPTAIIGQCGITLPMGLTLEIDEPVREVAHKFGFIESLSE